MVNDSMDNFQNYLDGNFERQLSKPGILFQNLKQFEDRKLGNWYHYRQIGSPDVLYILTFTFWDTKDNLICFLIKWMFELCSHFLTCLGSSRVK